MDHTGSHGPLAGQTQSQMQTEREVKVSSPAALGLAWKLSVLRGHLLMEKVLWPSFLTWNRSLVETGGKNDSFRKVQTEEEQRCYLRYFQARIFQVVLNPTLVWGARDQFPCLCFCGLCWDTGQCSGLWAQVRIRWLSETRLITVCWGPGSAPCAHEWLKVHFAGSFWASTSPQKPVDHALIGDWTIQHWRANSV